MVLAALACADILYASVTVTVTCLGLSSEETHGGSGGFPWGK